MSESTTHITDRSISIFTETDCIYFAGVLDVSRILWYERSSRSHPERKKMYAVLIFSNTLGTQYTAMLSATLRATIGNSRAPTVTRQADVLYILRSCEPFMRHDERRLEARKAIQHIEKTWHGSHDKAV